MSYMNHRPVPPDFFRAGMATFLVMYTFSLNSMAGEFMIENGKANAEIVISDEPPRMAALAALELQHYLERISGVRLPIVRETDEGRLPLRVFVGKSRYTDSLGITDKELHHGAFRMVSGKDWLVLLGQDFDFDPARVEPWARGFDDRKRAGEEWDRLTMESEGRLWRHPFASVFKDWWNPAMYDSIMSERYGPDNRFVWDPRNLEWSREYQGAGTGAGFWLHDAGGTLNAVCEFIRSLGVRWYMPGKNGEIIPGLENIPLPSVYRTVIPDFAVRYWNWYNYSGFSFEDIVWGLRNGMNSPYPVLGKLGYAHGHTLVHSRSPMKREHPDYYALIDGNRDTLHRGFGTICYSAEGIVDETVKFARFMFDHYGQPHVSIWPGDGFGHCQCSQCTGKSASELVWTFVDKVARELYRSHPDRVVSCGAYAQYKPPPDNIRTFTPNVAVFISNERRPGFNDPDRWASYWEDIESWGRKIAPGHLLRVENNLYSTKWGDGGYNSEKNEHLPIGFPVIHPHAMARDLQALKKVSAGECCEESQTRMQWHAPGVDHLNLYVQSRFLWDAGQDLRELLEEYYRLFYGPAAAEMQAAFDYAEANFEYAEANFWCFTPGSWRRRHCPDEMDLTVRNRLLALLYSARRTAGDTLYGERIQMVIDELDKPQKNLYL